MSFFPFKVGIGKDGLFQYRGRTSVWTTGIYRIKQTQIAIVGNLITTYKTITATEFPKLRMPNCFLMTASSVKIQAAPTDPEITQTVLCSKAAASISTGTKVDNIFVAPINNSAG